MLGTEGQQRLDTTGAGIDNVANLARIAPARLVGVDEILLDVRSNELSEISHVSDHGIVAQHVVPGMGCVEQPQHDKRADHDERPQDVLPEK